MMNADGFNGLTLKGGAEPFATQTDEFTRYGEPEWEHQSKRYEFTENRR